MSSFADTLGLPPYASQPARAMRGKLNAQTVVRAWGEFRTVAEWVALAVPERERPSKLRTLVMRVAQGVPFEAALLLPAGAHVDPKALPGGPLSWTWQMLEYEDDEWAQDFCARRPGGGTLEEVAAAIGTTRERTRQIEDKALAKLRALDVDLTELIGGHDHDF